MGHKVEKSAIRKRQPAKLPQERRHPLLSVPDAADLDQLLYVHGVLMCAGDLSAVQAIELAFRFLER